MNEVTAIILARGGSKGLYKKNIRLLNGKPLIAYSIESAQNSKKVNRVVVSTDDKEIARISKEFGADVPFLRPASLSDDKATSEVALKHAVEWLEENESYTPEIIVYLQPTEPLRPHNIIDDCVDILLKDESIDSSFAGYETHKNYWRIGASKNPERLADDIKYGTRRQEKELIYREDTGIALATRRSIILKGARIGKNCKVVPYSHPGSLIDIHEELDLQIAESIIKCLNKYK